MPQKPGPLKVNDGSLQYLDVIIDQQFLNDFVAEVISRQTPFGLRHFLSSFKDMDNIVEHMTMAKFLVNMPDLVAEVGADKKVDIVLNTKWDFPSRGPQGNFIKIRNDGLTIMQTATLDLMVEDPKTKKYRTVRKMKVTVYA